MKKNTNEEAEKLVLDNMRLVPFTLKQLKVNGADLNYDDLTQIGYIGLIKASRTFNEEKSKFSTYAIKCIRNEILMFFRAEREKNHYVYFSDEILKDGRNSSAIITYESIMGDPNSQFVDSIVNRDNAEKFLSLILNCFNSREKMIMLYAIAGVNQNDVSKKLNVTQSCISRTQKRVRSKLPQLIQKVDLEPKKYEIKLIDEVSNILVIINDKISLCTDAKKIKTDVLNIGVNYELSIKYINEKTCIILPLDMESFYVIAEIIKIIEKL